MTKPKFDLQQLSDRAAIQDVIVRYAVALDSHDDDLLASCFTDDATGEFAGVEASGGGRGIAAFLHRSGGPKLPEPNASHFLSNMSITLHGATADAESYTVGYRTDPVAMTVRLRGLRYRDRLVRDEDGEWRIARRVHKADWQAKAESIPVTPLTALFQGARKTE